MEYTIRQFQLEELNMLKVVAECLQKNNIPFYLTGGSCIGALRHKGFIPWDDDADIAILRKYFDAAELALSKIDGEFFYDSADKHCIPDAPIGHIFKKNTDTIESSPKIDIFAIDSVAEGKFARKYQQFCALVYHVCVLRRPALNRGFLKKVFTYSICKFLPNRFLNFLQRKSYKGLTKWKDLDTEFVSNFYGVKGKREVVPRAFFGEPRFVTFEDMQMPIPEKAEEYMTHIYGDFMEFPPEEERVPIHFKSLCCEDSLDCENGGIEL